MDHLLRTKLIVILIIFLLSLFFSLIPIKVRNYFLQRSKVSAKHTQIGLSACLCFGAGVLLAMVLLHMFPEIIEAFDALMEEGTVRHMHYPVAELAFCGGFFIMYFLEESVHYFGHKGTSHLELELEEAEKPNTITSRKRCDSLISLALVPGHVESEDRRRSSARRSTAANDINVEQILGNVRRQQEVDTSKTLTFRSFMIILALSFHGCFEGMALGLEGTSVGVWIIFAAITSHKIVIAFAIGMELLEEGITRKLFYAHMLCFCAAAPLGAAIGAGLYASMASNPDGSVAVVVLQAISGGTILFVVFCEVLERERTKVEGRVSRTLALFAGFVLMALLQFLDKLEHGHDDHDHTTAAAPPAFPPPSRLESLLFTRE